MKVKEYAADTQKLDVNLSVIGNLDVKILFDNVVYLLQPEIRKKLVRGFYGKEKTTLFSDHYSHVI